MADRWIVCGKQYTTHMRLHFAEAEARRLRLEHPEAHYRVYRVKTTLPAANTKAVLKAAEDVCAYIGYNLQHIDDPFLVALAAKLQYEIAVRTKHFLDEEIEEAHRAFEAGNA